MFGRFFNTALRRKYQNLKNEVAIKLAEREALTANQDDIVIISNPNGHIRKANRKCLEVLGYSEKEFYSLNYWTMLHPDDLIETTKLIEDTVKSKSPIYDFVCRVANKHGDWVRMKFHTQTGDGGILYSKATVV